MAGFPRLSFFKSATPPDEKSVANAIYVVPGVANDKADLYVTDSTGFPRQIAPNTAPSSLAASVIIQDATHRFLTDAERIAWNAKADATTLEAVRLALLDDINERQPLHRWERTSHNMTLQPWHRYRIVEGHTVYLPVMAEGDEVEIIPDSGSWTTLNATIHSPPGWIIGPPASVTANNTSSAKLVAYASMRHVRVFSS